MPQTVWTGGADDGLWSSIGNWTGGVPTTSYSVIFPPGIDVTTGNKHVTGGLDQTAIYISDLTISAGCACNIGSAGSPLKIGTSRLMHQGDGSVYFKSEQSTGTPTPWVCCRGTNMVTALHIDAVAGDVPARVDVGSGHCILAATAALALTRLIVGYTRSRETDAICTISSGVGNITEILQTGGRIICNHAGTIARMVQSGGEFMWNSGAITDPYLAGGLLVLNTTTVVPKLMVTGGIADLTRSGPKKEITSAYRVSPGEILFRDGLDVIGNMTSTTDPMYTGEFGHERGIYGGGRTR